MKKSLFGIFVAFAGMAGQAMAQSPAVMIGTPSSSGRGCPQGTVSAVISPDAQALSVLFDRYEVQAGGPNSAGIAIKGCVLNVPLHVPAGYSLVVARADYRGFNSIPQKGKAFIKFQESLWRNGRMIAQAPMRSRTFVGPVDQDFLLSETDRAPIRSACGGWFNLRLASQIKVMSNGAHDQVYSTLDSLDFTARWAGRLALRLTKCGR